MKSAGIDTARAEMILPLDDWRELDKTLAAEASAGLFAGVGVAGRIEIDGVRYLVKFST